MSKSIIRTAMKSGIVDVAKQHGKQIVKRESETVKLYARYTFLREKLKKCYARLGRQAFSYIQNGEDIPVTSEMIEYIKPVETLLSEMFNLFAISFPVNPSSNNFITISVISS